MLAVDKVIAKIIRLTFFGSPCIHVDSSPYSLRKHYDELTWVKESKTLLTSLLKT